MRLGVLLLCPVILAQAPGPKAPTPDRFAEKRAEILRSMADLRSRLQALEVELQILEEERQRAAAEAPSAGSGPDWRASPPAPASGSASSRGSAAEPAYTKPVKARCQAITTQGKRCTRSAEPGSKFCWQHRH